MKVVICCVNKQDGKITEVTAEYLKRHLEPNWFLPGTINDLVVKATRNPESVQTIETPFAYYTFTPDEEV